MDPHEAAAICRRDPRFVWLGMVEPTAEELATIQCIFELREYFRDVDDHLRLVDDEIAARGRRSSPSRRSSRRSTE